MKAMILAAGVGSRLDPLTRNVPKPMVPVMNQPVMEHIVRLLLHHGFDDIMCNTHYLGDQVEGYFGADHAHGGKIAFNREEQLLGTAGGVKRVADERKFFHPEETFLVTGGDDLTSIDLTEMLAFHRAQSAIATIGLTSVSDPSEFGVVVLDKGGPIVRFVEKPPRGTAPSNLVNTGVYLFQSEILDLIPQGQFYDFGKELFPLLLEKGLPFFGFCTDDYWRDVGNLREYRECHDDFFAGRVELDLNVQQVSEGIWMGENCEVDASAQIMAPVVIGANCIIGPRACVGKNSVLGEGCIIGAGATVDHSILWARSEVERETQLQRCIVGFDSKVYSNAAIFDGTIVSP